MLDELIYFTSVCNIGRMYIDASQEKRISWWQRATQSINVAGVNLFLHVRGVSRADQPEYDANNDANTGIGAMTARVLSPAM